ncbi:MULTISPECIES: small ribosomal subunit biogenesis GTPase RsgA [Corallincola]|uniref:Small ribosomal subunit biogenesis GTPase RsgA n=2 Tax=Corallincola TaxID=1775176 RepID=A0A368NNE7_9GAMM|nr:MULTISPECIES: small ribosomal subunit biogenesis GTPase RsgA [Corallincola]RCU51938.1 small ribosomal subunit biogenesis GTPase RsgA [Corallincola holothuriorum]TAA47626.1 small ribosomal subunit biogenesis GTPase RsgA [Corallincola spongiicola]
MAKKKKLTKGQIRRVRANQKRRLDKAEGSLDSALPEDDQLDTPQTGVIVSRFGQHCDVESEDGKIRRCNSRRTIESLVTGDKVIWRAYKQADESSGLGGVVEVVQPRTSELCRPDFYDGLKPVAANIDQILIVTSVLPAFSSQIIDRYLVASENIEIEPVIVLNKTDLLDDATRQEIAPVLENYRKLGYRVLEASSLTFEGLEPIRTALIDRISVFVGQSGVGKSSLINSLLPEAEEVIGDVSSNSGLGQHTTTAAKLLHLPGGGDLIDSPGVREFALWHLEPERVTWCFRELRELIGGCRFRDCKHGDDPGCIIREKVELGEISQLRYDNYHHILTTMDSDKPKRQRPL